MPAESPPEARNSIVSEKPGEKERRQQRAGDLLSPRLEFSVAQWTLPGPWSHTALQTHARTELRFLGAATD